MTKTNKIELESLRKEELRKLVTETIYIYTRPVDMFDDSITYMMKRSFSCLEKYEQILISLKYLGFNDNEICDLLQFDCSGTINYQIKKIKEKIKKNVKLDFEEQDSISFYDSVIYK